MIKNKGISLDHFVVQVNGNIVSDMNGEKVMLNVNKGKYYNLGEIGGEIWDIVKMKTRANQIVSLLMKSYDVEQGECEEQVVSFLNMLLEEGLIETTTIE